MHDESFYAERVLSAGGRGYVMKQEGGKKIIDRAGDGHPGTGARELRISTKTIKVHRASIKAKLQPKTLAELIRHAVRWVESERRD
jgi:hypothetical protein